MLGLAERKTVRVPTLGRHTGSCAERTQCFSVDSHVVSASQLSHLDKDFRYMACSDLTEELKRDTFKFDTNSETKVVDSILRLLEDSSGDVQGVAVKCLGPLVKKIRCCQRRHGCCCVLCVECCLLLCVTYLHFQRRQRHQDHQPAHDAHEQREEK